MTTRDNLSTATVRRETSLHSRNSSTRSPRNGLEAGLFLARNAAIPFSRTSSALPLRNYIRTLPVLLTIQHDKNFPGFDVSECLLGITRQAADPHPHHIHGRSEVHHLQSRCLAKCRVASVGAHNQIRPNFQCLHSGSWRNHSCHQPVFDQIVTSECIIR